MRELGSIISVICVCAITSSIINIISPQGNTKKLLNVVMGVFLLCSMIGPVKSFVTDFDADIDIKEPSSLTDVSLDAYNQAVIIETQNNLQTSLLTLLNAENISAEEIVVSLATTDKGGIYIDSISIYISDENSSMTEQIIEITQQEFQVTPSVILR